MLVKSVCPAFILILLIIWPTCVFVESKKYNGLLISIIYFFEEKKKKLRDLKIYNKKIYIFLNKN